MTKPDASDRTIPQSRVAHVKGDGPIALALVDILQAEGWTVSPELDRAAWLVVVASGADTDPTPALSVIVDSLSARSPRQAPVLFSCSI